MSQFEFAPDPQALQSAASGSTTSPIAYMGGGNPSSTHLIEGNGTFNVVGFDNFIKEVNLGQYGLSYAVVAIMGPQSSGKSTLLNHLFGTNFKEMDAFKGRSQTTKGIWMAHCVGIHPCTLIMDIEGSDGVERGEKDDTAFEKQSALFALAISDVVMINMWCHDIGREQAANRPLLKIVFQAMLRLFSRHRKTTFMFVIRDKTRTPLEILEPILRKDIQKIWDNVPKPEAQKNTPLSEFFNVEVVALSSYELQEEQFKKEVANLRQRFNFSTEPDGLAGDRRGVVPASGFSFSAQEIWKVIKADKDLDLPAHKVMVATIRCEEIANEMFSSFIKNKEWCELEETVRSEPVDGFGKKLTSILDGILSQYNSDAEHFEEGVRLSKQKQLLEKLLQSIQPAYRFMLGHIRSGTFDKFKEALDNALSGGEGFTQASRDCTESFMTQFDKASADADVEQANWEYSFEVGNELQRDIEKHIDALRSSKLCELTTMFEKNLSEALAGQVEALLDGASDDTWPSIRTLLHREIEIAVSGFSKALSGFEMDDVTEGEMISSLKAHARGIVEAKVKEEAEIQRVLLRMKDRFIKLFCLDSELKPRTWTKGEDITAIVETARSSVLKLLSVMTAIRLDNDHADSIERILSQALSGVSGDLLASRWDEVPPSQTLLTPVQCKSLWSQFQVDTVDIVGQAKNNKAMVATIRCEEIANEKFSSFIANKKWRELKETVGSQPVDGFGTKLTSILDDLLLEYDAEAKYFEEGIRLSKQTQLVEKLFLLIQPAHQTLLRHIRSETFGRFKEALDNALNGGKGFTQAAARNCRKHFMAQFDKACEDADVKQANNWNSSEVRERDTLGRDMDEHIAAVRASKLSELTTMSEKKLYEALARPVEALLIEDSISDDDTWPSIRKLLHREIELAVSGFSNALYGFEMDGVTEGEMISRLKAHARGIVEAKAKEAAGNQTVFLRMKERFIKLFCLDSDLKTRTWTKGEDMAAIMETALSSALTLLSVMTAIRLDDHADSIKEKLFKALLYSSDSVVSGILLASNRWDEVPPAQTLLTPAQCKYLWSQLQLGTAYAVEQAKNTQEANKPVPFEKAMGKYFSGFAKDLLVGLGKTVKWLS